MTLKAVPTTPPTLGEFLSSLAQTRPDTPALLWNQRAISYRALLEESRRVARGLAELGIGKGDRVAIWLPNAPAWLALLFACARLGAIAVAVNTRFRSAEIADIIGRSGAKVLAFWPGFKRIDFAGILAGIDPAALDRLETVILVGEGGAGQLAGKRVVRYEELVARPAMAEHHGTPESGTLVFTTSGTTKAPKFVLHSQASLTMHAAEVARSFGYSKPNSVVLQALPLCGTFGLTQAMAGLAGGAVNAMLPTFDAGEALATMARHGVTGLNGTDEMIARLIEGGGERAFREIAFCGYAAFDPALGDILARADRVGLTLVGLYGASEVQALYAHQKPGASPALRARPGGFVVSPSADVRVRNPETGRLLGIGESGELELAGPSRMKEYLGNPEATAAALTEDGYVRIGDIGHLAEDGSFVFEARGGDVLRLSGFLVSPSEIESFVQSHPAIDGCQVVGVSTPKGTRPVAFVTMSPGATLDEGAMRDFCASGLARFKVPAAVIALAEFPTTQSANGMKIQKAKLRELAETHLRGGG